MQNLLRRVFYVKYEACPESKETTVLNMHKIFNLQNDTVKELPVHNFIFNIVAVVV